jgi:hypothetical protein
MLRKITIALITLAAVSLDPLLAHMEAGGDISVDDADRS